jgi:hypothetical protein
LKSFDFERPPFLAASFSCAQQKAELRAEIAELQAELPPLRTELTRLHGLLDRCYIRQTIAVPIGGGVLVNA